jgi:hypothetical protein
MIQYFPYPWALGFLAHPLINRCLSTHSSLVVREEVSLHQELRAGVLRVFCLERDKKHVPFSDEVREPHSLAEVRETPCPCPCPSPCLCLCPCPCPCLCPCPCFCHCPCPCPLASAIAGEIQIYTHEPIMFYSAKYITWIIRPLPLPPSYSAPSDASYTHSPCDIQCHTYTHDAYIYTHAHRATCAHTFSPCHSSH